MAASEDYLLRHIAMLRQFIAQIMGLRQRGQTAEALHVMMQAQEGLFARPFASFSSLPIEEQLRLLGHEESKEGERERQLGYALLLREAGLCYQVLNRDDLAASAWSLALHVALFVAVNDSKPDKEIKDLIGNLLSQVKSETLYEPTRELLKQWLS